VQDGREDLPRDIELVVTDKVRVVAFESIKNEGFVGLGDSGVGETFGIGEVELDGNCACGETGELGVHLHVNGLRRLDSQNELVSGDVVEDASCRVLELNSNLDLGLVECCKGSAFARADFYAPFPAFMMNGTPSHRGLLTQRTIAAKVGLAESLGTVSSSW
jgi:hypothetical protein